MESNWNKFAVPEIRDKTAAVFTGDVGSRHPYFAYDEDGIDYYGVGFGFDALRYPPHFLDVDVFADGSVSVKPILIREDIAGINSLESKDLHQSSFRERVPRFSYERLRIIVTGHLKKISVLLAAAAVLFGGLSAYLMSARYRNKKQRHEQ